MYSHESTVVNKVWLLGQMNEVNWWCWWLRIFRRFLFVLEHSSAVHPVNRKKSLWGGKEISEIFLWSCFLTFFCMYVSVSWHVFNQMVKIHVNMQHIRCIKICHCHHHKFSPSSSSCILKARQYACHAQRTRKDDRRTN